MLDINLLAFKEKKLHLLAGLFSFYFFLRYQNNEPFFLMDCADNSGNCSLSFAACCALKNMKLKVQIIPCRAGPF